MRCRGEARAAQPAILEESGNVECFGSEPRLHGGVEEERAHTVIEGTKDTLGYAILLASVRIGEEHGTMGGEQGAHGSVIKLKPVSVCRARMGRWNCV